MTAANRVLQWNCRSLRANGAELSERLRTMYSPPVALLLQETRGTTPSINGYRAYFQPSILHDGKLEPTAQAAIFISRNIRHCQLDTSAYCTAFQEVVAVRIDLNSPQKIILVSVYLRPETGRSNRGDFAWMTHLRSLFPGDAILIGGDFNASNVIWGYPRNTPRGAQLEREAQAANLTLVNDLDIPTRTALHSRQKGTTPDLTWTSHNLCSSWSCENDPWGSDHYPIWVSLKHGLKKRKRKVRCTDWDLFRQHLADPSSNSSEISALVEAMQQAMILATQEIDLPEELPTPDKHMLNLWETRE